MENGTQNLRGEFIKIHWNRMRFYADLCFERKKKQMDGWMDGWVDIDRWINGWMDGYRQMDEWMDGWIDGYRWRDRLGRWI